MTRYRLKDSVYVAEEPLTGRYIAQRKGRAVLAELPFASHFGTHSAAALYASEQLAGSPHELVRVDK